MTRDEMIEALASYFKAPLRVDENGEYDVHTDFDWVAGASTGHNNENGCAIWLTLENVVEALEDLCEEEEDDPYDKWDCELSRDDWDEEESWYAL